LLLVIKKKHYIGKNNNSKRKEITKAVLLPIHQTMSSVLFGNFVCLLSDSTLLTRCSCIRLPG
jgi:hypothetical protein